MPCGLIQRSCVSPGLSLDGANGEPTHGEGAIGVAKKATVKKKSSKPEVTFEEALEALEAIVHRLEEGQLPLAEALDQYEQGVRHLKVCYKLLEGAERRIELLKTVDADGTAVTEPFDERATYDESPGTPPRKRANRRAAPRDKGAMDAPGTLF